MLRGNPKVKVEVGDDYGQGGACAWTSEDLAEEIARASDPRGRLREDVRVMAAEAGMSASSNVFRADSGGWTEGVTSTRRDEESGAQDVNKHGGAQPPAASVSVKTPKYSGKADWEAFHAQFELLAHFRGWSNEDRALQLALCLTDDALACLILISPEDRRDYGALVGALRRRYGQCVQPGLLRSELSNRRRQPGEPLRVLANDIESLSRRAYAHMPPYVQSELARDQFIQALSPTELRIQTQLAHPESLQIALEMALERELVWAGASAGSLVGAQGGRPSGRAGGQSSPEPEKPACVADMTELIRAVSLQVERNTRRGPRVCWGCGQTGHLRRDCPKFPGAQGNGSGSALTG